MSPELADLPPPSQGISLRIGAKRFIKNRLMDVRANRFLDGFSPAGRECLISFLIHENYPDGAYLFHEGEQADGLYLVLDGEVQIVKVAGSRERVLGSFHPGDFLGEVAVLDGFGRSTGARAVGEVAIAKVPREPLLRVLATEPVALTLKLFQQVLAHLRKTNELFVQEVLHKEKLSLVGEMANSLMHDLRNPLSGIRLVSELITLRHSDAETIESCERIRLQCDRIAGMAGELLEFSRGESTLHVHATTTTALLRQFEVFNEEYMKRSGIEFTLDAKEAGIEIDSMRMQRLLQNLVANAVEAIGKTPQGRIEVRAGKQDGVFFLSVRDNGPGIPEAVRDRLFEPFVTHGKKHGTGLGMAIAQNIVAAHRGAITFETATGQGTTFLVRIPQK
jgi:signal transduction histidine kinase